MGAKLWEPSRERIERANLTRYLRFLGEREGLAFRDYRDLHAWSVRERARFWQTIFDFGEVLHSRAADTVLVDGDDMLASRWFRGARLNYAENLLRRRDDHPALVFRSEEAARPLVTLSYRQLHAEVARVQRALHNAGVAAGDRVVGFLPNVCETVIAMLGAASLGAIWSSCSPDFGFRGVLDRFGQIAPKILFAADGYFYNGKRVDCRERVATILRELPSIERVVVVPYLEPDQTATGIPHAVTWSEFLAEGGGGGEVEFLQLPFDHPLYVLYSSGTTGVPKCMVHGAGGTLLQHFKELVLHSDLDRSEAIFYFTTCGWMMWNWLVSSLMVGATVVLFDGSPFHPDAGVLWRLAQELPIHVFGTSAKYLAALEKSGFVPGEACDLRALRAILSTGSPLSIDSFRWVYRAIKPDLQLASIAGGSDLISCFALGNPTAPVYEGELQCRGLGMDVDVFDSAGKPLRGEPGELVCKSSFPSQPIEFWNDPDRSKYRGAYFEVFPNVWCHGDWVELTEHEGLIIYGRSDATLNPGGVRIGTAEIYRPVEGIAEVLDSLVVGQDWDDDVRVILFVQLAPGVDLAPELVERIKRTIRSECSPRHVPAKVIAVPEIPYTISGKKVELAVRRVIHRQDVKNRDALRNPEALAAFADLPELAE